MSFLIGQVNLEDEKVFNESEKGERGGEGGGKLIELR